MSFIFTKKRIVKSWPETITVAADNGEVTEHKVTFDLELIPEDEWMGLLRTSTKAAFDRVLLGWSGINDETGQPLADTEENREALCQFAPFNNAVVRAYRHAASGEAARKN